MSGKAPLTESLLFATAKVTADLWLDSRAALWHPGQRWLAVADLHYGYELTMHRAGGLFPQWGMEAVRRRLKALLEHYQPETLILNGDVMDSHGCAEETLTLLAGLRDRVPRLVCVEGNHERRNLLTRWTFQPWHREGRFLFHHGHDPGRVLETAEAVAGATTQVTGHWHPAAMLTDGAGTRVKLPALVRQRAGGAPANGLEHWTLPAFSPWAAGSPMPGGRDQEVWGCHPTRVFRTS